MGSQRVAFTSRMSCPGQDDVVSRITGFQVVYASGHGEFSDPLRPFGAYEDGAFTNAGSFPRP